MAPYDMGRAVIFRVPDGATPLTEEEREDLIPDHITTREQLNEWEYANILEADRWAFGGFHDDVLTVDFLRELHRRMFDRTWSWAGRFRQTGKNIGVAPHRIPVELLNVCRDAEHWIENDVFPAPRAAARYHHGLVAVHPFPDGNGRLARLAANVWLHSLGHPHLEWGTRQRLYADSDRRAEYIRTLRHADARDFEPLYSFLGL